MEKWYAEVIGYGFSLVGDAILAKNLVETLWKKVAPKADASNEVRRFPWQGEALARIEALLYVAFLEFGLGYLIGVWVSLKVVGQWGRWNGQTSTAGGRPEGWAVFNVFLIGNALTVFYALVGFALIGMVQANQVVRVVGTIVVVFALTIAFWAWISGQKSKPDPV
jgi:hypothetical protein